MTRNCPEAACGCPDCWTYWVNGAATWKVLPEGLHDTVEGRRILRVRRQVLLAQLRHMLLRMLFLTLVDVGVIVTVIWLSQRAGLLP
jgi:hypothetical protein